MTRTGATGILPTATLPCSVVTPPAPDSASASASASETIVLGYD